MSGHLDYLSVQVGVLTSTDKIIKISSIITEHEIYDDTVAIMKSPKVAIINSPFVFVA